MASLWMLHGTGVQVKCTGHVEGERWIDLKSLLVTFLRLPQAPFQTGLSISHLRVLFFNGLYFIWIAKPALTPFENSSAEATSERDEIGVFRERQRDGSIARAHIFIVLPHKTSKLCKHSSIVPKSCRAFAYPQSTSNKNSSLDFNMLTVGCWKDWQDRQLKVLAKANISTQQQ